MKKIFIIMTMIGLLVACGGGGDNKTKEASKEGTSKEETSESGDLSDNPDYQKGLAIASKSDCFTCHKIDEKNIGPAWREVANKYAGQDTAVQYLAKKIIEGGSGVWGTVMMLPHANFTQEDAEAVAKYVLLLKK